MLQNNKISNDSKNLNPQCKVVVYAWDHLTERGATLPGSNGEQIIFERLTPNDKLAKTTRIDISSQILSCNFTKRNNGPTGNFTLTLSNSPGIGSKDWKDILKRGMWLTIKLTNNGDLALAPQVGPPVNSLFNKNQATAENKYIRCIGRIDRVSVKGTVNPDGGLDYTYQVTGRDFGVVYSDTVIWHNIFYTEQIHLESFIQTHFNLGLGSDTPADRERFELDRVLRLVHNLFYDPSSVLPSQTNGLDSFTNTALQWLIPTELAVDLGFTNVKTTYWGNLPVLNISKTLASMAVASPIDYLTGNAWQQLKKISVPAFHELFTETTNDGKPQLIFRPIPFAIDKSNYPTVGKYVVPYRDLENHAFPYGQDGLLGSKARAAKSKPNLVEIPALSIETIDLGEDDTARYNSFLTTIASTTITQEHNITYLRNTRFPFYLSDSIKRHGFRPMHVQVDTIVSGNRKKDGAGDDVLMKEFNELLLDYWIRAIYAESGSVTVDGHETVKLGKILKFTDDVPYASNRRYYIEGYTDDFSVGETGESSWTQTIFLTNGYEESDLADPKNADFGNRNVEFKHSGEFTKGGAN